MYLSANLFLSYRAIGLLASHFAECPVASEVEPHPLIYLMQTLQFPLKSNTGIQRLCASLILTEWATSQKVFKFLTLMVLSAFCNVSLYIDHLSHSHLKHPRLPLIHLYHSVAILESVGNKGFVFALSLPVQPHTE